jgi:hypothetical protein
MFDRISKLLPLLKDALSEPLFFVDVGCSEGIDAGLRQFEPNLAGIAIDPLVAEVARLTAAETNPAIAYVEAWIDLEGAPGMPGDPYGWFPRSSARRAGEVS